jgi:hypothetical protein
MSTSMAVTVACRPKRMIIPKFDERNLRELISKGLMGRIKISLLMMWLMPPSDLKVQNEGIGVGASTFMS